MSWRKLDAIVSIFEDSSGTLCSVEIVVMPEKNVQDTE